MHPARGGAGPRSSEVTLSRYARAWPWPAAALQPHRSETCNQFHRRHRSVEFRTFLDAIDAAVPPELDVHLILDNYATHKTAMIWRWLAKRPRYYVHFTPSAGPAAYVGPALVTGARIEGCGGAVMCRCLGRTEPALILARP